MQFAQMLKQKTGACSGAVFASGVVKAGELHRMCEARETIRAMSRRILEGNQRVPITTAGVR
jgi:hypothetical protein